MRSAPPGGDTKSSVPKSGKDNKKKMASKPENPQDKKTPTLRLRKKLIHVDLDSTHLFLDDEENESEELALVTRTRKRIEVTKSSKPETLPRGEETPKKDSSKAPESPEIESASSEELKAVTIGHSNSLPSYYDEAIKDARALRTPDPSKVLEEDPFQDCFTRVEDAADLNDASTLFEEAHRLLSRDITKFKAELIQCEAELKKSLDEKKALRLLCIQKEEELKDLRADLAKAHKNKAELDKQLQQKLELIGQLRGEVDQVKVDYNQWKENMDRLPTDKEVALSQLASAEIQLRGAKLKNLAQAKKIEELEAKFAEIGAEVAEAKAEVKKMKATANKTITVYLKDAEAVQAKLRKASDWEKRVSDLAKCQSRREALEEIRA
uniref:Uveal autoantigen with coiled-coil domains and ankyrin repeats-like n=1 Tax=Nicotiana tabacum TaxID=4097 RepID=A0A1S3ZBB6_TOBAC|nr:PREDICTED: uveal autoantigen with coiled-coil domains and ankyrin repeats-like [Nicotiana tabacum]